MVGVEELLRRCDALLGARAEGLQVGLARSILTGYEGLSPDRREAFLVQLATMHEPDPVLVRKAAEAWEQQQDVTTLRGLLEAAEPRRRELFRRLHLPSDATVSLVRMRAELLTLRTDHPELRRLDLDMHALLSSWFTRSFLELRRIDWGTPALVLERIATNEAVHEVADWLDLRARVQPPDRRCYGFFHPAMPDEPLIFVMIALTRELPSTIAAVLETRRRPLHEEDATQAVFYSITNCQPGLRGVSLGNFLIKQVVATLSADLPQLEEFRTLSPIEGMRDWLGDQRPTGDLRAVAARYLLTAKRADGQPLDPVSRFHLGNGASLDRILPGADVSERGLQRAFGVMASYRYDLARVTANHDYYASARRIAHSDEVAALLED